jgi:FKBP-type peptidyl-prolyl cis-trans isomerase FkpA
MFKVVVAAVAALALSPVAKAQELKDDSQKTLYALGLAVGRSLEVFKLTPAELEVVKRGLSDQVGGKKTQIELEQWQPKIQGLLEQRQKATAEALKTKDKGFVDQVKKEKGAQTLPSGLIFVPQKEGTGAQPKPTDTVKVHYTGTLVDGTEFDSSVKRGQPAEFPLNQVIKCWTEGVGKMKVGGKAKLVCPAAIAYGEQGRPPVIPGGATLVFDVELLETKATPAGAAGGMPPGHPPKGSGAKGNGAKPPPPPAKK